MIGRSLLIPSLLLAAASFGLSGCKAVDRAEGKSQVMARYVSGRLTCDLPPTTPVASVLAAANAELRTRGYAIKSSESTEQAGELVAVPPRYASYPRLVVSVTTYADATRVEIEYQPWGDEQLSRGVLGRILEQLGL